MPLVDRYGPWAVVAGGSEGVGAGFARQLAAEGLHLLLVGRSEQALRRIGEELGRTAPEIEVRALSLDLTDARAPDRLVHATAGLDVGMLVLNAGANTVGSAFLDADPDTIGRALALGVSTPLALVHAFGRGMRQRGRGGIVLVGSLAGYLGQPSLTVYSGAKAFTRVFAEGLWLELRDEGVDVLHVVLGVTRTPAMERSGLDLALPGLLVTDPDEVAAESLAHLRDGPVWVVSGNEQAVAQRSTADRARAVVGAYAATRRLLARRGTTPSRELNSD